MNDFNKIEEKLNKIDLGNDNKYDLLNLYESVELSITEEVTLSEMLESNEEAKKIHDFLCGTLNEDFDEDETDASDKKVKVHYYASNIDAIAEETFDYDYFVENKDKILNSYDDVIDAQVFDGEGNYIEDIITDESLSEAQERQAKIEVRKVYSWYEVLVDNVLLLKHLSEEDAKEIMKTMDDNNYPYIYRETEESRWAEEQKKKVDESSPSMAPFVERQTRNYTKEKGFIQCNHGSQEDEIVSLLKDHYPTVTVEPRGKRGVTVRYSKSVNSSLDEDTVKQGSQWVNKGKEGVKESLEDVWDNASLPGDSADYKGHEIKVTPYGYQVTFDNGEEIEFADDREAMEYIDSLNEGIEDTNKKIDPKTLPDDYVLLNSNVTNYTDEDIDLYYDCIREFCNIDEIDYDDLEVTFITNQRDADDWDEETYTSSWKYRPDDYKAEEYANDYLAKKYPNIITVGDIKKSADDVYEYIKSMFWEEAQEEAQDKLSPADFELY